MKLSNEVWTDANLRICAHQAAQYLRRMDPLVDGRRGSANALFDAAIIAARDVAEGEATEASMEAHAKKIADAAAKVARSRAAREDKSYAMEGLVALKVAFIESPDAAHFGHFAWSEMLRDIS